MGSSFLRVSFPLTVSLSLRPTSLFTSLVVDLAAQGRALLRMAKESSLPPSLIPHLYDRPQEPQRSSPTSSSPGAREDVDLSPPFDSTRQSAYPLPPLVSPPAFADPLRPFPAFESGAHDPASLHAPAAGSSSIPHGSAHRYRSPVLSDPIFRTSGRPQAPSMYPGAHSLPNLPPITPPQAHWREGEAGPSSLAHQYPVSSTRQISPGFPLPQPIYRRSTEPGGYSSAQSGLPGSYDRFRDAPPLRGPSDIPFAEGSQGRVALPPLYLPEWPTYGSRPGEQADLPPIHSALHSHSPVSSDARGDEGDRPYGVHRKLPDDFEENPRRANIPKKILVACDFCRGRKLRCDGAKPICSNCNQRNTACFYRDTPKRRGPGKAAKGTRSKKRATKGSKNAPKGESSAARQDAPSLRSRASTDSGVFSQGTSGRYGSPPPTPPSRHEDNYSDDDDDSQQ
ncbi:hypothetical protein C8F01DRAFT_1363853 [Mycena amicta]|nr:hypothetical protein C8F01DRAFT_1363853 [Mycena amicta]